MTPKQSEIQRDAEEKRGLLRRDGGRTMVEWQLAAAVVDTILAEAKKNGGGK